MNIRHRFTIVIEKDADGYYAYCPQFQGCYAQGDTYEEVIGAIEDVVKLHIKDRRETDEKWAEPAMINVTSLEFAL